MAIDGTSATEGAAPDRQIRERDGTPSIVERIRMLLPALPLSDVCLVLDELAARTGEPALRRAANALRQESPGRRALNDRRAIAEAESLFACGKAKTMRAAFTMVARTIRGPARTSSIAERLRRKWAASKKGATK